MNKNPKQESLQEMIQMLKGDYNFPVKLWVWGKVVKEWAGIIIVFARAPRKAAFHNYSR